MSILVNTGPTTLTKTWYVDGTATDVGTVTIGIVDANGDTVVSSGTAVTDNSDGTYEYALAVQTEPTILTVTWTSGSQSLVDELEVVGGWLFTENQARNHGKKADETAPLASATEYPDSWIADERDRIADLLEQWTGVSWIPRYNRERLYGTGTRSIEVEKREVTEILSATVSSTSVSTSNVEILPDGLLWRKDGLWTAGTASNPLNVTIEYVHGYDRLRNGVDRIALDLLLHRLVPRTTPDNLLSMDTEFGTQRFIQAGGPMRNPTGLPKVDQWIRENSRHLEVF